MHKGLITGELSLEKAWEALNGNQADIVYTDPPWGPGMLSYFHTLNHSQSSQTWDEFLNNFCKVVTTVVKPGGHIFVEMGERYGIL